MGFKETCENKLTTRDVTNSFIRYHSKRGYFWFVFVKPSEMVGFSSPERHSSHKNQFWELVMISVAI